MPVLPFHDMKIHMTNPYTLTCAAELISILREKRPEVGVIVAPYEADAQLAFLVREGHVDVIVGEDSDTIPFGCKEMIYKLAKDGSCTRLVLQDLYTKATPGFDMREFTPEMTVAMCVAAGCDYLKNIKNFGLKKAYEMIKKQKSAVRMVDDMKPIILTEYEKDKGTCIYI